MKNALFVLLISIISLPVYSDAMWKEISNRGKILYLDVTSITSNKEQSLYWVKNRNQDGYKKMLIKSDCSNNTTGIQKIITYDNNDNAVGIEDLNQELSYVVPDSDAQAAYNYVCNKHREVKENAEKQAKKKGLLNTHNVVNTINGINNVENSILDTVRIFNSRW